MITCGVFGRGGDEAPVLRVSSHRYSRLRSFVVVQCFTGPAASVPAVPVPVLDVCGGLLELFGGVPGPEPGGRSGQGRDHPAAAVLALAAAALVVAGVSSPR